MNPRIIIPGVISCFLPATLCHAANLSDDGSFQLNGYGMVAGDFQSELNRPKNMSLHTCLFKNSWVIVRNVVICVLSDLQNSFFYFDLSLLNKINGILRILAEIQREKGKSNILIF